MAEHPTSDAVEPWRPIADSLVWQTPYATLHRGTPPGDEWFAEGRFNLAVNCTDRHLATHADRPAILWEGEPGDRRALTYRELHQEVLRLTAALRGLGAGTGDRVALHLGWLPETVATMLACFRLGAECTVVPVSLPVEALSVRLADFAPTVLFTQDGGWRHGAILPLKARADAALESSTGIQHTVVVRRTGVSVEWYEGDLWYHDIVADADAAVAADPGIAAPAPGPAEQPVLTAHLANRRGRPVAVQHGAANLAVVAVANHHYTISEGEVFWCAADIAWLGTQTHGVVGPLLCAASTVMYEGTLDVPTPERAWQIVERYGVTSLLTSPPTIRALRNWSLTTPGGVGSLRRWVTLGDRLDPELRDWLHEVLGHHVAVADGWGQIELVGMVTCDVPVDGDRMPDPGFAILDPSGQEVAAGETGEWVMKGPWAGLLRGVDSSGVDPTTDHWDRYPGHYATGDLARRTTAGRVEFLGRMDEVTNVSGQLVALNEVRDVLQDQPFVLEADAFEVADLRLGRAVAAAVVLDSATGSSEALLRDLQEAVREVLGGLSRPRCLLVLDRFGPELDHTTRRRVLGGLAQGHQPRELTWEQVVGSAPDQH